MAKKSSKEPLPNPSQILDCGIPTFNRAEKLCEVIPVKVGYTLKKAIPKPQSTWIREAIIEKLERLEEDLSDA